MSQIFRPGIIPGTIALLLGLSTPGFAQFYPAEAAQVNEFQADVIIIGDSPDQWDYYNNYWQQLINGGGGQPSTRNGLIETDPNFNLGQSAQELAKNLVVRNLKLNFIIKLNGSSQLSGILTNKNKETVTVQGVNFEILDPKGNLIQTGSAVPQPNVIAPGQSVTFQENLLTVSPDANYRVKLADFAFIVSASDGDVLVEQ